MSTTEPDLSVPPEGSPRPPTRVPGVWHEMPRAIKILLVVLLAVAAGGVAFGVGVRGQSADNDNGVIEQLIPMDGNKLLQQERIGIDLREGYDASLSVNGTPIPDDQADKVLAFNQVTFQPGPGKVFEAWPAGKNCIVATYWRFETGPAQSSLRRWCFTVL